VKLRWHVGTLARWNVSRLHVSRRHAPRSTCCRSSIVRRLAWRFHPRWRAPRAHGAWFENALARSHAGTLERCHAQTLRAIFITPSLVVADPGVVMLSGLCVGQSRDAEGPGLACVHGQRPRPEPVLARGIPAAQPARRCAHRNVQGCIRRRRQAIPLSRSRGRRTGPLRARQSMDADRQRIRQPDLRQAGEVESSASYPSSCGCQARETGVDIGRSASMLTWDLKQCMI